MTTRVAIVGSGNISRTHALAARDMPGVAVTAHWSRNLAAAETMAREFGGTAYDTLEECFARGSIDVALIGTPSGVHADHATIAVRHGVPVIVEKPLDTTTRRIDALLEEGERRSVTIGVFFQDRTAPPLVWLKSVVASGALGRLLLATAQVKWYRSPAYYSSSSWRGTRALDGGGALMNQGTHTVDLLLWLAGDVDHVFATTRAALHAIEVEDTAVACLEFANGAIGTIEATTAAFPGFPRRLELTGSEGTAVIEGDRVTSVELHSGRLAPPAHDEDTSMRSTSPVISDIRGHRRIIEDFLTALAGTRRPVCDGREGRRSVALVEAIYESARTQLRVPVDKADETR